jgi:alpha-L-rhamnosidase
MTSLNHDSFGVVSDWLHRMVAGLAAAATDYMRLEQAATHTSARLKTLYGIAKLGWRLEFGQFTLGVTVPFNTAHCL